MSQTSIPYINFEISWLQFNQRVLDEGLRRDLPILERLKYLSIVGTNLDEFVMVRMARLLRWHRENRGIFGPSGMKTGELLEILVPRVRTQVETLYQTLEEDVLPSLAKEGLTVKRASEMREDEIQFARRFFGESLFSILTPRLLEPETLALRETLVSGTLYVLFHFSEEEVGIVKVPDNIDRFVALPAKRKRYTVIPLEELILRFGERLFPDREAEGSAVIRVTRDANLTVEEESDEDFLAAMEEVLDQRQKGRPIRLEYSVPRGGDAEGGRKKLREALPRWAGVDEAGVVALPRLPDLSGLLELVSLSGYQNLRFPPWEAVPPAQYFREGDIWHILKERDLLLHHPYESFEPVVTLLERAAADADVLAIKMTLYRTSGESPIVRALERAARKGKQVTVLVEVKARFDEGRNIGWAKRLELAGAIVIHGMRNLKVHAKATMVVRREEQGIRQYVHLGTGNYNDKTARKYTDMGLLTSRTDVALDTALFFNAVTGHSTTLSLKKLVMAPLAMRGRFTQLIHREMDWALRGREARITAKLNALNDPEIISLLYEASEAGVQIDLNIRGACSLIPGIPGKSSRIRVVSIIDRYLEHTRIYGFTNGGKQEIYLSSADWRTRNLDHRVELLIPLEDREIRRRVRTVLEVYFRDNTQAHRLNADGEWERLIPDKENPPVRAQELFHDRCRRRHKEAEERARRELQVRRRPPE